MSTPSPDKYVAAFDALTDMQQIIDDCNARIDRMLAESSTTERHLKVVKS